MIRSFLNTPDNRQEILQHVLASDSLDRFADLLRNNLSTSDVDIGNRLDFVRSLAQLAEKHETGKLDRFQKGSDILAAGIIKKLWWIIRTEIEQVGPSERKLLFDELFADSKHLTISTLCLHHCLRQHGKFKDQPKDPEGTWLCTPRELSSMQSQWLDSVQLAFRTKAFCSLNGRTQIIRLLPRVNKELAADIVAPLLKSDNDLDCLARAFGVTGADSIKGPLSEVKPEFLKSIGGVGVIRKRVRRRLKSKTPLDAELKAIYNS